MKVPYDIKKYLSVGTNKEELFNLIRRAIAENNTRQVTVYFCLRDCFQIKQRDERPRPDLFSNHEEADTKLVAYAKLVNSGSAMVRSPSGDIDIVALFVYHFTDSNVNIFVDNGTGSQRKIFDINSCTLLPDHRDAMLGNHAVSGNDYLSSFFRKGKKTCWKKVLSNKKYIHCFSELGLEQKIGESTRETLESFICSLYGRPKIRHVNEARSSLFWSKYRENNKIIELCLLPPCRKNLDLHLERSNYIAYLYKNSDKLVMDIECPTLHGRGDNGSIKWVEENFPGDITEILLRAEKSVEEDELDHQSEDVDESDDADICLVDFS